MNKVLILIVALVVLAVAAATLPVVEWLTDFVEKLVLTCGDLPRSLKQCR